MIAGRSLAAVAGLGIVLCGSVGVAHAARTVPVPARAALVLTGAQPGDLAGASVGGAGDVNGDGKRDIVVGASLADRPGRPDAGAAYVVFGGGPRGRLNLGALGARGFAINGAITRERSHHPGAGPLNSGAGAAVAGAGDVNGDGLDDLLVSGRVAAPPRLDPPYAVFVVFGKRDSAPVDLGALGSGGFAIFTAGSGAVVAGHAAGDVNGDGHADIGVQLSVDSDEDAGAVAVVFGKADSAAVELGESDPTTTPAWGMRLVGVGSGLLLGGNGAVGPAGDVNRDGLGDLLVGAPGSGLGRRYGSGSVFVVYGRRAPAQILLEPGSPFGGLELRSPRLRAGFGASVARLGGGFVAGAPGSLWGRASGSGALFVSGPRGARPRRIAGPASGGPIGLHVAVPGDVDRDGRADLLAVPYGKRGGGVAALLYRQTGRLVARYRGLRNGVEARATAAGAGDTNGDGRPDLVFGSPGANAAYVLTAP